MIFKHTASEPGMWRGWLADGQVLELHWSRRGWDFGAGILVHSGDDDRGRRMICLSFWRAAAYVPLGITMGAVDINDEPQWSAFVSKEHGLWLRWGFWSKRFDLPGSVDCVAYEMMLDDGSWTSVFRSETQPYSEKHPYTYTLASGEVQHRTATVSKHRHVLSRTWLRRLGWPTWVRESINVEFDGEVGEGTGSWKGGTIGCGWDILSGETMGAALRRMEAERKFR